MKSIFVLNIVLILGTTFGCFVGDEQPLTHKEKFKNMVLENIDDLLEFADEHKSEKVEFDLTVYRSDDGNFQDFAIFLLITEKEMKQYIIYNMEYLDGLMHLLSTKIYEDKKFDESWDELILNMGYEFNHDYGSSVQELYN